MFSISKNISDGENYFTQNKYNKLQKISAKNTCFLHKISAKVQIWDHLQFNSTPVAWGDQNSANVCPCTCRKRRLIIGYKLSNTTGLLYAWSSCMQ